MYIVIELQTINGVCSTLTYQFETQALAEQKYYTILSAAAVSQVDVHAAVVMTNAGYVERREVYIHNTNTPEPEN